MNTGNQDFSDVVERITPKSDCPFCHGTGEVHDSVPYGSTNVLMPSLCECVEEQMEDPENGIEIVIPEEIEQMWEIIYDIQDGERSYTDRNYYFGRNEDAWNYGVAWAEVYFGEGTEHVPGDNAYYDEKGEVAVRLYTVRLLEITAMTEKGTLKFTATWKVA